MGQVAIKMFHRDIDTLQWRTLCANFRTIRLTAKYHVSKYSHDYRILDAAAAWQLHNTLHFRKHESQEIAQFRSQPAKISEEQSLPAKLEEIRRAGVTDVLGQTRMGKPRRGASQLV